MQNVPPQRLIAIGDIHGCLEQLIGLIHRIDPTPADQLVFLGDYIDRGPNSSGVISYLLELQHDLPATVFLRGNHERMFLDYLDDRDPLGFMVNGGTMTLKSYRIEEKVRIPREHIDFLQELLPWWESENFIFVHAGLRPGVALKKQKEIDYLWIRDGFLDRDYDFGKLVVHGHTPMETIEFTPYRIGLDTGCVYGRYLSACDLLSRKTWSYPEK